MFIWTFGVIFYEKTFNVKTMHLIDTRILSDTLFSHSNSTDHLTSPKFRLNQIVNILSKNNAHNSRPL